MEKVTAKIPETATAMKYALRRRGERKGGGEWRGGEGREKWRGEMRRGRNSEMKSTQTVHCELLKGVHTTSVTAWRRQDMRGSYVHTQLTDYPPARLGWVHK